MFKLKGIYEWKLVNKDTGIVRLQGRQENLTTDAIGICMATYGLHYTDGGHWQSICLSSSAPPVGIELRQGGIAAAVIPLTISGAGPNTLDPLLLQKSVAYSFDPSVAPRTIRTIGVSVLGVYHHTNFGSFIELSVPITQQTNEYLYVKYTLFVDYTGGGNNVPNNRYVTKRIRDLLFSGGDSWVSSFIFGAYNSPYQTPYLCITPFIDSVNTDKIMRGSKFSIYTSYPYSADLSAWSYDRLSLGVIRDFTTTEIVGPMGALMFYTSNVVGSASNFALNAYYGRSPIADNVPSISRVFVHPASRIAQIFSDPAYPPSSQGTIALSGTPAPQYPVIGRIHITKTGDASDIVEDGATNTFLPAAVNTGTNEITLSQSYTKDTPYADIVRFTNSGGALPSGISAGTDYYVIQSGTVIKLSLSQGGLSITISDQGTGTHTILRQNTGRFSLELEPYNFSFGMMSLRQLMMGLDINGKMMPHFPSYTSNPESMSDATIFRGGNLIDGVAQVVSATPSINNVIWSTQRSVYDGVHNVCKWPLMSVETSEAVAKFGGTSTVVRVVRTVGQYLYIGTSDGIYKYDTLAPLVDPTLLSITGIINSDIRDLAYDAVTGKMWSGHTTGLSKIDLGTLIATQYTTSGALSGLSVNDVYIVEDQLQVDNGLIVRGKVPLYNYTDSTYGRVWAYKDGVSWVGIESADYPKWALIRKGHTPAEVVVYSGDFMNRYTVDIGGSGVTRIDHFSSPLAWSYQPLAFYQNSDTSFMYIIKDDNVWRLAVYSVGSSFSLLPYFYYTGSDVAGLQLDNMDRPFYNFSFSVDAGDGVLIRFLYPFYLNQTYMGYPVKFGWNSAWTKDNLTDRRIPKTGTTALLQGISVAFNNATGKNWDQQFVADERFTWVHAPYKVKDNLQTMQVKSKIYFCNSQVRTGKLLTVPASFPYTLDIDERAYPDFRDMDTTGYVISVMNGVTALTKFVPGSWIAFTIDNIANDKLTISENITVAGTPIEVVGNYNASKIIDELPLPLIRSGIYYAILVDSTHIKLARTYAEALLGTAIDIISYPTGTVYYRQIAPTTGTYYPGSTGIFVFSSVDSGNNLTLTYPYSLYS